MNYAGLKLGTWYPQGGFYKIIEGMWKVAEKQGVKAHLNAAVEEIVVEGKLAKGLKVNGEVLQFDGIGFLVILLANRPLSLEMLRRANLNQDLKAKKGPLIPLAYPSHICRL